MESPLGRYYSYRTPHYEEPVLFRIVLQFEESYTEFYQNAVIVYKYLVSILIAHEDFELYGFYTLTNLDGCIDITDEWITKEEIKGIIGR